MSQQLTTVAPAHRAEGRDARPVSGRMGERRVSRPPSVWSAVVRELMCRAIREAIHAGVQPARIAAAAGLAPRSLVNVLKPSEPRGLSLEAVLELLSDASPIPMPIRSRALADLVRAIGGRVVVAADPDEREIARPLPAQALGLAAAVGGLAAAVQDAFGPDSPHGQDLGPCEADRISDAARDVILRGAAIDAAAQVE